jgi:hypothetical protein
MSTPEGDFETALDESADAERRERAIDELRTANECDRLADIAERDGLGERYRALALEDRAHPQCRPTLSRLVEDGGLPEALHGRAESLLSEISEGSGAEP